MKDKKLLPLFSLLVITISSSFSQEVFKTTVKNPNLEPQLGVYVMAYSDATFENSFFAGNFPDATIQFNVPDSLDCFYLRVSDLDYELYESKICKPWYNASEIVLKERNYELEAVVIKGFEKTEVRVEGSIATIRPGQLISSNSALTAESVIKSLPEVLLTPQENIMVRGREIEKIYMYATPNSPKTAISFTELSAVAANQIDTIQIDYLQSEISIYLKHIKTQGIASNSRFRLQQGKQTYGSLAQNLRAYKGDTYYWLDLNVGLTDINPTSTSRYLVNLPSEEIGIANSTSESKIKSKYFRSKLFVEHQFDSIYSGGLQLAYQIQDVPRTDQVFLNIGTDNKVESYTDNESDTYFLAPSLFLQGNYKNNWKLSLKAGVLSSLQKSKNIGDFNYQLGPENTSGLQILQQRIATTAYTGVLEANKKWGTTDFTIRTKGNFIENTTDSDYLQDLINVIPVDSVFTNRIKEYKVEVETELNTVLWEKYIARFTSNFIIYDYSFFDTDRQRLSGNKLLRVLPGFSISAPIKETKYLTLYGNSYMRSPNFSNLIFRSLSGDGFSENENNYSLKPFTSYQLGISYPLLPNTIASFYWSTTKNNIINYPYFSQTGVFEGNRKLNLFDSQSQGLSLSYSKTFWQRLFLSINSNIMRNSWENKGEYEFSTNYINMLGNVNLYYMSKTDWSFNLDYTYSSKQKLSENIELNNSNLLSFSISKKLDNSWSIFLSVNDLLNSYKLDIYANNNVIYESVIMQDQRYVTFGITYGFNKGFKQKKREENLMDDLNKRIRIEEDL